MENSILKELLNLGFTENEAKVYLACLEIGKGSVTQISKKAGINRTTGYDILERLSIKGLINMALSRGKKRLFSTMSPNRLSQYIEGKKNLYEKRLHELEKTIPKLQLLYKETELKPVIKIAEGIEAMKQMAFQELDSKSTIYSFANLKNYAEAFDDMGKQRSLERYRKGIKEKCLSIDGKYAREWYNKVYGGKNKRQENTEYRWLKTDNEYFTAGEIVIFEDKVIGILSKTSDNVSFEIKSESFANFLKILFEIAWESKGKRKI
ncbi:MAG: helix-turn-helix domain-containing protein [Candidatus Moraniibacteriota bacterium]